MISKVTWEEIKSVEKTADNPDVSGCGLEWSWNSSKKNASGLYRSHTETWFEEESQDQPKNMK